MDLCAEHKRRLIEVVIIKHQELSSCMWKLDLYILRFLKLWILLAHAKLYVAKAELMLKCSGCFLDRYTLTLWDYIILLSSDWLQMIWWLFMSAQHKLHVCLCVVHWIKCTQIHKIRMCILSMKSPHKTWKLVCASACLFVCARVCLSLGGKWKWCLALKQDSCANRQPWCQDCRGFWVGRGQTHFDARFYSSPQSRCGTVDSEEWYKLRQCLHLCKIQYKWKQVIYKRNMLRCWRHTSMNGTQIQPIGLKLAILCLRPLRERVV